MFLVKVCGMCFGVMFKVVLLGIDVDGNVWLRSIWFES